MCKGILRVDLEMILSRPVGIQSHTKRVLITRAAEIIFYEIQCDNVGYDILCDIVIDNVVYIYIYTCFRHTTPM